jgi:tripartite ATP-independent transporter DctM subunit
MTPLLLSKLAVLFGVLFVAMFLRIPFFFSCFAAAAAYAIIFPGAMPAFVFAQTFVHGLNNQVYAAVVFYFLLGAIFNYGGLGDRMVRFANACIGHMKGSLSHINVIISIVFAGVSGTAIGDTASVGNLMIPMMKKQGYPAPYAAAITQMSSIIGPIIPPSAVFVIIASMLELSVRRLFLAGLIPGILMGLFELGYSIYISKKRNYPCSPFAGWKVIWKELKECIWALLLPVGIIICLTVGIGTVTEIAAASCAVALFLSVVVYKEMDFKGFISAIMTTARQVASTLAMLAAATVFVWIIGTMNFSTELATFVAGLGLPPAVLVLIALAIIFVLGMVLDSNVITVIFLPVMAISLKGVGVDLYHFAVLAAIVNGMGLNTPPVGSLLYLTSQIAECDPLQTAKESIPFILCILLLVIILVFFPQIITFYPNLVAS